MDLRLRTSAVGMVLAMGMAAPAFAAPLSFPDVPANHWAKDAVETLAAKHIVEGYPDGTFKGDRATTRWELAMVVARLLKQIEDGQSNFATKQDLEAINRLANSLKDELEALGQRVTKLEGDVSKLDQRVTELERITFYGSLEARLVSQCFTRNSKTPITDNDWDGNGFDLDGNANGFDYDHNIGTFAGANMTPAANFGVLPVADYTRGGVALTNGTGFSMKALLGLRIRVSDDVDAGAEFAAYSSVGDTVVDAFWGVSAPHSCNPFTANISNPIDGNSPYTRMVLDNFWVMHNPSGTKLTVGAYNENHVDNILYAGQPNYGAYGNKYLDNFGFDVNGSTKISDWGVFRWELMGTRLADGTDNWGWGNNYQTNLLAADLGLEFGAGQVKVNFLRVANDSENSESYNTGLINGINMDTNMNPLDTVGMTPDVAGASYMNSLQWVNPYPMYTSEYRNVPVGPSGIAASDDRPITNGGNVGDIGLGTFGAQQMVGFSVKADYKWDIGENGNTIYAAGQYARTQYKANKNSNYTSDGNAYKIEVGTNLLDGDLDLAIGYVGADPNYDPFVNVNPMFANNGIMNRTDFINFNQYSNMWSLHDVDEFAHNRKGFLFNGQWRFDERRGLVWAKAKILSQTKKSLYDTMHTFQAADGGLDVGSTIMGFDPGFMDPVFYGYASPTVYGTQSAQSFAMNADGSWDLIDAGINKTGHQNNWGIGASYKWENPRIKVDLGYEGSNYKRDTVAGLDCSSQNYVDLSNNVIHLGLGWEANDKWTLRAGCDWANTTGHWDPAGQYNVYSWDNGNIHDFDNIKVNQVVPYIGFDYDMTANTQWNLDLRYYDTRDGIDQNVFAGATTDTVSVNAHTYPGYTAHPFSWYGWQVTSQFKIKF
ncbi:S-layer homology domain-containing protein [bacterium]|nr:S-layer homology domain-containing protein [bacterium]